MIPGFYAHAHELHGKGGIVNNSIFNPYNLQHNTNLIGDKIEAENEHNSMWHEVSEFLINCGYKLPKNVRQSKHNELSLFSLNVRSLTN